MAKSAPVRKLPSAAAPENHSRAPEALQPKPAGERLNYLMDDKAGKVLATWSEENLMKATGASNLQLAKHLLGQAVSGCGALSGSTKEKVETLGAVVAQLASITPGDAVEGMLAAQLVACHNLAMSALATAARVIQPAPAQRSQDAGMVDRDLNRGLRLMAAFQRGLDALERRRGKGQQRIIVEHIDQAVLVQGDPRKK